jgi:hypothetical protein
MNFLILEPAQWICSSYGDSVLNILKCRVHIKIFLKMHLGENHDNFPEIEMNILVGTLMHNN